MLELVLDIQVEAAGQRCKWGVRRVYPQKASGREKFGRQYSMYRWYLKPWDWIRSLRV